MNKCRINDCPLHSDNECPRYDQDNLDGCRMYEKQKVLWDFTDRFECRDEDGFCVKIMGQGYNKFYGITGSVEASWDLDGKYCGCLTLQNTTMNLVPKKPQAPKYLYTSKKATPGKEWDMIITHTVPTNQWDEVKYIREDK